MEVAGSQSGSWASTGAWTVPGAGLQPCSRHGLAVGLEALGWGWSVDLPWLPRQACSQLGTSAPGYIDSLRGRAYGRQRGGG